MPAYVILCCAANKLGTLHNPTLLKDSMNNIIFLILERGRGLGGGERQRETLICCSTYFCIHWLILVCALTRDQTLNLGTSK